MILIIAVLAILLLIACCGWWNCYRSKQLVEAVSEFNKNAVNELQIWLYEEKQTVEALESELADLKAQPDQEFKELVQEQEDELGFGHHVKWRSHRKPTALTYQMHFDMDVNGQRILEELTVRFKRNAFTDNERETCRRLGRAEVVDFIINRINTANDPRYDESLELAHMEQNNE
ncbi:Bbp19 family protein [Acinetobacter sp. USHLN143]|uniref:Bbp19 family protein n=1 Tax=Acinetobacter sp. USHLN143 TaxID=3081679 RepID=UPI003017C464